MLRVPHLWYVLALIYLIIGVVVVRRAFSPSCRICLYRHSCPNRERRSPLRGREINLPGQMIPLDAVQNVSNPVSLLALNPLLLFLGDLFIHHATPLDVLCAFQMIRDSCTAATPTNA